MAWSGGIQMIYNLDDFRDINTYDEIKKAPPGFEEGVYPYFTHIGEQLQTRIQTLALAYAISQKAEYGQRAVHYVMKLCDWQIWSQADAIKSSATDMGCSYVTNAAAIVYDMCYDLLTEAGRKRGYLMARGEINTERMAKVLIDEYRLGKLGRFTLEEPEEML